MGFKKEMGRLREGGERRKIERRNTSHTSLCFFFGVVITTDTMQKSIFGVKIMYWVHVSES